MPGSQQERLSLVMRLDALEKMSDDQLRPDTTRFVLMCFQRKSPFFRKGIVEVVEGYFKVCMGLGLKHVVVISIFSTWRDAVRCDQHVFFVKWVWENPTNYRKPYWVPGMGGPKCS